MTTTVEVLVKARELIAAPDRFTRFVWAVDNLGHHVSPVSRDACAWSVEGAIERAGGGVSFVGATCAVANVLGVTPIRLAAWQADPGTTHAAVLRVLDATIAREKAGA